MKKIGFVLLLSMVLFSACNKEENLSTPDMPKENIGKGANVARLYALKEVSKLTQQGVAVKSKMWPAEATIKIKFLNGTPEVRNKVKNYASQWEELINLTFEYVADTDNTADVKIGFDYGDPDEQPFISWLTIGTDCQSIPQDEASINFVGFYDFDDEVWIEDEEFIKSEVLRAFGCVLGLDFEHRSPNSHIQLLAPTNNSNKNKLRGYFGLDIPIAEIEERFIGLYTTDQTNYTDFDDESIMVLPLPTTVLKDPKYAIAGNTELSETDKQFISMLYPKDLKVEWLVDAHPMKDICIDKYDNLYFFTSSMVLMKLDTNTGVITQLFEAQGNLANSHDIAVDGHGNIYLNTGTEIVRLDNNGVVLDTFSKWEGSPYASNQILYTKMVISDNDDLIYSAAIKPYYGGNNIIENRLYRYNPSSNTHQIISTYSPSQNTTFSKITLTSDNYIYSYQNIAPNNLEIICANTITGSYSTINPTFIHDDIANSITYHWSYFLQAAGLDRTEPNFVRTGQRERYYVGSGCWEMVFVFYTFNPQSGIANSKGMLPTSIIKEDNSIIEISHYQPYIGASSRDGKVAYVVVTGEGSTHYILKITGHR